MARKILCIISLVLMMVLCLASCDDSSNDIEIGISEDGYWVINGEKTDVKAEGTDGKDGADGKDGVDGKTPYIQDGYWYIDGVNTGVKAEGVDGEDGINGTDGKDGINGTDGKDGINGTDGEDGVDGKTPYIQDGYWYIDGVNTGIKAEGVDGVGTSDNQGLIFYPQDDGTYIVSGGNAKYMKNINIPTTYCGGSVVAIEEYAFNAFTSLESINIPNSVKTIGQGAFAGCLNLESVNIADSVITIDKNAFAGCSNLTTISIPSSVRTLGQGVFADCLSLNTIYMPCYEDSLCFIDLFLDASADSNSYWGDIAISPIKEIHVTGGDTIPASMFYMYGAEERFRETLEVLTIGDSITCIWPQAFESCPENIFTFENGIYYIGKWAVYCNSADFVLRDDTIGIAGGALMSTEYDYDESITEFELPASVKYISPLSLIISPYISTYTVEDGNETYCAVDGVVYTKDLKTLVQYPIVKSNSHFDIPQGTESIAIGAFYECMNLTSVTLPDSFTTISKYAFVSSYITNVEIPSSVTSIGERAFGGCYGLASIVIPDSVTSIGDFAFAGCSSLTNIVIPGSVTSIGDSAFSSCSSLAKVVIGESVTSIGNSAFYNCSNLYTIHNNSALHFEIGSEDNGHVTYYAKILVENGETVFANDGYGYILTDDGFLFRYNSKYELIAYLGDNDTVTLPNDINGNSYELYYVKGVKNVIIPEGFTSINNYAFSGCRSLTSIVIPNSVTSIGSYAFQYSSLTSVTIPGNITSIGDCAFYGCHNLSAVIIPASVTYISTSAFRYCSNLTNIVVDENNQYYMSIDGNLYSKDGKTLIKYASGKNGDTFIIPNGVITVGSYAFDDCYNLESVVIPTSITTISEYALDSYKLNTVYYMGTQAEWNKISIHYSNYYLQNATINYYKESHPTESGNYWRWVDNNPTVWCCDIVIDEAVEPTCTNTGLTEGAHCSVCQEVIVPQTVIDSTGHGKYVTTIVEENIVYFTTINSTTYPFSISGNLITSTNKANNSSSTYTINAKETFTLQLEYKVSSESNYDKLIIKHNSREIVVASGTSIASYTSLTINMSAGDVVTIIYSKDSSVNNGDDCAYVKILSQEHTNVVKNVTVFVPITESNSSSFASCTDNVYCDSCEEMILVKVEHNEDGYCQFCGSNAGDDGINKKSEGVMTWEEYMAAELDSPVIIEAYVQATQSWWNNKIIIYLQDLDGGYFAYEVACSETDAEKLVPGTKIKVAGYKAEWAGEVEIIDGTFEFVNDGISYIANPVDVTSIINDDSLIDYQNMLVSFKDMTFKSMEYKGGERGDDIYVTFTKDGVDYNFAVERYLTGPDSDLYKAVEALEVGDVVDVEGFLYWYNGMNPLITKVATSTYNEAMSILEEAFANSKNQSYWKIQSFVNGELSSTYDINTVSNETADAIFDIHHDQLVVANILKECTDKDFAINEDNNKIFISVTQVSDEIDSLFFAIEDNIVKSYTISDGATIEIEVIFSYSN